MFALETERLNLRPLTFDEAKQLHQLCDLDPEVWKFVPGYERLFNERVKLIERLILGISNPHSAEKFKRADNIYGRKN